jgi:primosomal protein N' (replication factor Y)
LSDAEKVEIWDRVMTENQDKVLNLILGVRSSLFLPFRNLGLVIVDEEHDGSYKQQDPSPRYHARDSAIMLASVFGAKTLLGSATPSIESYHNAISGKYGFTQLTSRYGNLRPPEIFIENTREAYRKKSMVSHFTPRLLTATDNALENGEQVILFRNRRGFSPYIECSECGFIPVCYQCAVSLTYHREKNRLVCHYCGYSSPVTVKCGNCSSATMVTRGFGTEKLEDEIKIIFPGARVARLDYDTTRSRNSFSRIIGSLEKQQTDILIGTQMISKGLDFENLTVVGILNADSMLNFPDFRAHERAFQLITQVSGRAGRRSKQGKVIIQTTDPENRILRLVLNHDYEGMFNQQLEERKLFIYPPFSRIIKIVMRHKDKSRLNEFSGILGEDLRKTFGRRVLGPESPSISRIQLWYLRNILIKIERDKPLAKAKNLIKEAIERTEKLKGASSLRISVDVDPY